MIKSFGNRQTEDVFLGKIPKGLQPSIVARASRSLRQIDSATQISDLRLPPSNHLEKLSGNRAGQWSIRINQQWRIVFEWREDNNAYEVEIVDYH